MEKTIKDKVISYLKYGAVEYIARFQHNSPIVLEIKHRGKKNENCGQLYYLLDDWFSFNLVWHIDTLQIYTGEYIEGVIELDNLNPHKILVRISFHETGKEWMERVNVNIDYGFICNELKINTSIYDSIESVVDDIVLAFKIVNNKYEEPVRLYNLSGNKTNNIPLNARQQELLNDYVMKIVIENAPAFWESFGLEDFVNASCEEDKYIDYEVSSSYIIWDWDDIKPD